MKYIVIICCTLLLFSCTRKKQYGKLVVMMDSTVDYDMLDEPDLFNANVIPIPSVKYDTISKSHYYAWDSLETGTYTLDIPCVFGSDIHRTFDLKSDSIIKVGNKKKNLKKVAEFSKEELRASDSIVIIYIISGCFSYHVEKTTLTKQSNHKWSLKNRYNHDPGQIKTSAGISDTIIDDFYKIVTDGSKVQESFSTTRYTIHIISGEKHMRFEYFNNDAENMYGLFKSKYLSI